MSPCSRPHCSSWISSEAQMEHVHSSVPSHSEAVPDSVTNIPHNACILLSSPYTVPLWWNMLKIPQLCTIWTLNVLKQPFTYPNVMLNCVSNHQNGFYNKYLDNVTWEKYISLLWSGYNVVNDESNINVAWRTFAIPPQANRIRKIFRCSLFKRLGWPYKNPTRPNYLRILRWAFYQALHR